MAKDKYYSVPKARDEFERQKGRKDIREKMADSQALMSKTASDSVNAIEALKLELRSVYSPSRELSLAITKLDEAAMWIERIYPVDVKARD